MLRHRPLIIYLMIGSTVLVMLATGLMALPVIAPDLTATRSPFYRQAFRAALESFSAKEHFLERLPTWKETALLEAERQLTEPDIDTALLTLQVVKTLSPKDADRILALGLRNPQPNIFWWVAENLQVRHASNQVPALLTALAGRQVSPFDLEHALAVSPLVMAEHFPLTRFLRESQQPAERALACSLLAHVKTTEAMEYIFGQIGQYRAEIKINRRSWDPALAALAENGSDIAISRFCEELSHPELQHRMQAMLTLNRKWIDDERLGKAVLAHVQDPDLDVAQRATQLLVSSSSQTVLTAIDYLLSHDLPTSELAVPEPHEPVDPQKIPVLLRFISHPKFGTKILISLWGWAFLTEPQTDLLLDRLESLSHEELARLMVRLPTNQSDLTQHQKERWRTIRARGLATPDHQTP